ncbi:MAG: sigma-70 family RNA polymerase sigma factor [Saprospiraceae bacterium]|nr:sigma-70 family RNA polymerase sigma factor [Saprospiraceae bacterium]
MNKELIEKKFEEELLPYIEALNTFAFHLTYNEEDAADLVQETYMKAFRNLDKYEVGTNAKAWLFRIMKNTFINSFRKRNKLPSQVSIDNVNTFHSEEDERYSGYMDLRTEMFDNMMGDEVTKAIDSIPLEFRTIILLCDIEEFSYEDISKILDIPLGTVRSRLHRARNLLKNKLRAYAATMGYEDKRNALKKETVDKQSDMDGNVEFD